MPWLSDPRINYYTDGGWQRGNAPFTSGSDVTKTKSFTSDFANLLDSNNLFHFSVVGETGGSGADWGADYVKLEVTYFSDCRLNWEHRVTGIGSHDSYRIRIYGYADSGETFSIKVWNGSTWVDNYYNLPVGASAWVDYQIPSNWVIGGTVSIKYDDDTDGDTTAQSIHIDYCGVRGTTAAPAFDFSVSASPDNLSVQQAGSISTTVSVALTSGTAKTVSLSGKWIGTAPGGVTPSFSPSSGTPNFGSILTFSTTAAASTGTFTYQVKGTGGGQTHSTNITLTINEPAFDFSVSASPDILSVQPGSDNTTTVTVTLDAGSTENVTLSGSWIGGTPRELAQISLLHPGTQPTTPP